MAYKEVDKKYTGCNLKSVESLDCAVIRICGFIRSNMVCFLKLWRFLTLSHYIVGNPEGRHVVIIDDLIQTGGTLKECGKVLPHLTQVFGHLNHLPYFKN